MCGPLEPSFRRGYGVLAAYEGVRLIHLGRVGDPDLGQDRPELLAERVDGLLGLPDVDDSEPVGALAGDVHQDPVDGPVGQRLHLGLPACELLHRPVVVLLGDSRALVDEHDRHALTPSVVDRGPTQPTAPSSLMGAAGFEPATSRVLRCASFALTIESVPSIDATCDVVESLPSPSPAACSRATLRPSPPSPPGCAPETST